MRAEPTGGQTAAQWEELRAEKTVDGKEHETAAHWVELRAQTRAVWWGETRDDLRVARRVSATVSTKDPQSAVMTDESLVTPWAVWMVLLTERQWAERMDVLWAVQRAVLRVDRTVEKTVVVRVDLMACE